MEQYKKINFVFIWVSFPLWYLWTKPIKKLNSKKNIYFHFAVAHCLASIQLYRCMLWYTSFFFRIFYMYSKDSLFQLMKKKKKNLFLKLIYIFFEVDGFNQEVFISKMFPIPGSLLLANLNFFSFYGFLCVFSLCFNFCEKLLMNADSKKYYLLREFIDL